MAISCSIAIKNSKAKTGIDRISNKKNDTYSFRAAFIFPTRHLETMSGAASGLNSATRRFAPITRVRRDISDIFRSSLPQGAKVSQRLSPSPFHSCVPFAKWTQSCVFTIYNTTAAVLQPLFCNFVRIGIYHKIEGIFLILYANVSLQYELFGK